MAAKAGGLGGFQPLTYFCEVGHSSPPPHFCRIINNFLFFTTVNSSGHLLDWRILEQLRFKLYRRRSCNQRRNKQANVLKACGHPQVACQLDMLPTPDAAGNEMSTGIYEQHHLGLGLGLGLHLRRHWWSRNRKFVRGTENHRPLLCHTCVLLVKERQRLSSMRLLKRFQSGKELKEQFKIWLWRKPFQIMSRACGCRIGSSCTSRQRPEFQATHGKLSWTSRCLEEKG